MNDQIWLLSIVVLVDFDVVFIKLYYSSFIGVSSTVIRSTKQGDYLRKIAVLPDVGFETLKLGLMSPNNRNKLIF